MSLEQEFNDVIMGHFDEEVDVWMQWVAEATTDRMLNNWDGGQDWLGNTWGTHQSYGREGESINLIATGDMVGSVDYTQLLSAMKSEGYFSYSSYPPARKGGGSYAEIQQMNYQWHPMDFSDYSDFDQSDIEEADDKFEEKLLGYIDDFIQTLPDNILKHLNL